MSLRERIVAYFKDRKILLGIIIAITASLVMTAVSLKLYDMDDVSRLDVSLPERENIRKKTTAEETTTKFDSFGTLDDKAFADFKKLYSSNREALNTLGKFDSNALDSSSLKISTNE